MSNKTTKTMKTLKITKNSSINKVSDDMLSSNIIENNEINKNYHFYDYNTKTFYDSRINDNIPSGCIELTEEECFQYLQEINSKKKLLEYDEASGLYLIDNPDYVQPEINISGMILDSINNINAETDRKILTGFWHNGINFYLSMENQFNFKNEYDLRDTLEYPVTVKTMDDFYQIKSAKEYEEFYLAAVKFIRDCIEEGWRKKAEAEQQIINTYKIS